MRANVLVNGTFLSTARSPGQIAEMAEHAATLRQSQLRQLYSVWVPCTRVGAPHIRESSV